MEEWQVPSEFSIFGDGGGGGVLRMACVFFQEEKNEEKMPVSEVIGDKIRGFWIPVLYTHCNTSAWIATSVKTRTWVLVRINVFWIRSGAHKGKKNVSFASHPPPWGRPRSAPASGTPLVVAHQYQPGPAVGWGRS